MANTTRTKTWLAACALIGAFAVTGCGGGTPSAENSGAASQSSTGSQGSQQPSPAGSEGGAAASSAPGSSDGATTSASPESNEATYELTETYKNPDGLFTVKYPKSWKATTDRGYLELESPDGKVTGAVAPTATRSPGGGWFTRPTHPLVGDETGLSKQLGQRVSTYSTYLPAPPRSDKEDSVLWGLTESDNRGIVSLPKGGKKNDLWVEFYYSPVNEGNRPLPQREGVELVHKINQTDDAGTVDAILKSIRVSE